MPRETMDLESTPMEEDCASVGDADYTRRAKVECTAYMNQLYRIRPKPEDSTARLRIKANPHDFGTYYTVEAVWDLADEAGNEWAYYLEANMPAYWDNEALLELQAWGYAPREPEPPALPAEPVERAVKHAADAAKAVYYQNPPSNCDACQRPFGDLLFDQRTTNGQWGNLCAECSSRYGMGIGPGVGQQYQRQSDGRYLKVAG